MRLKPLQTIIYMNVHKTWTVRATTCPSYAFPKQNTKHAASEHNLPHVTAGTTLIQASPGGEKGEKGME